jgi:hypothetical protein
MLNTSSPLFIELLLWTIYVLLAVALGLTCWSLLHNFRLQGHGPVRSNGIPVGRIAWSIAILFAATMGLTFATGSTASLTINGRVFSDTFWLRTSDMFINTSLILIIVAIAGILIGMSGIQRKN